VEDRNVAGGVRTWRSNAIQLRVRWSFPSKLIRGGAWTISKRSPVVRYGRTRRFEYLLLKKKKNQNRRPVVEGLLIYSRVGRLNPGRGRIYETTRSEFVGTIAAVIERERKHT